MTSNKVIRKDNFESDWQIKWLRRLKLVVGVFSCACFLYQSVDLTTQYLKYATVVTTELINPKRRAQEMPAVTVCKPFVFGYRQFCNGDESDGECMIRWAREAGWGIDSGSELNIDQQTRLLTRQVDKLISSKPLLQLFSNISLAKNFHGTSCDFDGCPNRIFNLIQKFDRTEKIVWSIIKNGIRDELCFTAFSQLVVDYEKFQVDGLGHMGRLVLVFNYSEWFPSNFTTNGYNIAVHPASLIPSETFWQFHRILPNNNYQIEYGMTSEHLLPGPYQTNCRNYSRSGSYQPPSPFSHYDCLVRCTFNNSWYPKGQCYRPMEVVILNHLQPTDRVCSYWNISRDAGRDYASINRKCEEESCPKSCYEEHFWSVRDVVNDDLRIDKNDDSNSAQVTIRYSSRSYLIIRHQPEIEFASFIGNIGGLAGVYLGISILSMYEDFCSLVEKVWRLRDKIKVFAGEFKQTVKKDRRTKCTIF